MAAPKTYFVMTNFDLSPNDSIQLGSIIADPLEPEEILNPGDVLQIPSDHDVETLDFVPSQIYVDKAVNKRSVCDYLEGCQYQLPVYTVTGLKIGRGLSNSLPPSAGYPSTQEPPKQNASFGKIPDLVIGYRLVRIIAEEVKDVDAPSGDRVMGKMLGDSDERDTDFGSLKVTLTANIDGGREVEAHEIVGSQRFIVVDEDGDKECNCIVVTRLAE
ncbi:hypothetical protein VTL71DRAFT_13051 [Oculimacula yallundae]|uniref:Uncharacterized protein n=1 Tax=Oculimacula yallundae TaxID=86028 RepID=A0ABR4CPC0_9HELO